MQIRQFSKNSCLQQVSSTFQKYSPHDVAGWGSSSNNWNKGSLNAADQLRPILGMQAYNLTALTEHIVRAVGYPPESTTLWQGFFSTSLPRLMRTLNAEQRGTSDAHIPRPRPAVVVDIDCDIYEGTIEAMEWLIHHQLLVAGTLVYYDDWRQHVEGEVKAHYELEKRFKLKWRRLETGSRWNKYLYQLMETPSEDVVGGQFVPPSPAPPPPPS